MLCENKAEEEIFSLYSLIISMHQAREKTRLTHTVLEQLLCHLANLLIIRLESYLDTREEKPSRKSLHYTSTSRAYSEADKDKLNTFYKKYKDYRDKRLCHYNNSVDVSDISLLINEIKDIVQTLFKTELHIAFYGYEQFFISPLIALNKEKVDDFI